MPQSKAPVVMTLDAGGTNFVFSAIEDGRPAIENFAVPSCGGDLERSLDALLTGFRRVQAQLPRPAAAISFAFPGPADYARGIIRNPPNLPAYRDVPLGPMLEDAFGLPVFVNNDGDLFAYGEAIAGFLPYVNSMLERAGSPKRYRNLFGVTVGTGLGGGLVIDGNLLTGDNSAAAEVWLLRHKSVRDSNAEEGASARALRRAYASACGLSIDETPDSKTLCAIAEGGIAGNRSAAQQAFRTLGGIMGDVIAQVLTVFDGLTVIGGGIAPAHRQFLPALVAEMNGHYQGLHGNSFRRLIPQAFNLEDPAELELFLAGDVKQLEVPRSGRTIEFDALSRVGVGLSRLGTNEATAVGAYAFAVSRLNEGDAR